MRQKNIRMLSVCLHINISCKVFVGVTNVIWKCYHLKNLYYDGKFQDWYLMKNTIIQWYLICNPKQKLLLEPFCKLFYNRSNTDWIVVENLPNTVLTPRNYEQMWVLDFFFQGSFLFSFAGLLCWWKQGKEIFFILSHSGY